MCRREVKAGVDACPSCGAILENAKAWQIYHPEPAPSSSHARTIALSGVLVIILCVAYQGWEQPPKQAPAMAITTIPRMTIRHFGGD